MNHTNSYMSTEYILQGSDVIISIFTLTAMSFVPASFVLFIVYERCTKSLHLQFLIGLNPLLYWCTNFLWDLLNYMLPASCAIGILRAFDVPAYVQGENFGAVIALFAGYGWSISPLMYPSSFLFIEPSNAYIFLIVINLLSGITCVVSSFLLQVFVMKSNELDLLYSVLRNLYSIFPPYCLGRGLIDIAYNDYYNIFYAKTGQPESMRSPFAWDVTLRNLVSMASVGALSWLFTLLLEYDFFKRQKTHICRKKASRQCDAGSGDQVHATTRLKRVVYEPDEDVDVVSERLRVNNNLNEPSRLDCLTIVNLNKTYRTKAVNIGLGRYLVNRFYSKPSAKADELTAVKDLTFGVPYGECFGLLGVNGAG
jgi:ATP-binding cassette subfamily A (ABC1) protein 2